jgi:hypothetical protein
MDRLRAGYARSIYSRFTIQGQLRERCALLPALGASINLSDYAIVATLLLWFGYLRERAIRGGMPSRSWTEDTLPRTIPVIQRWLARDESQGANTKNSQHGATIISR